MKKILFLIFCMLLAWVVLLFAQEQNLIFSHKYHANEVGAECVDCHSPAESSLKPSDNLLPEMGTCYNCHDEDETECSLCHSIPDMAEEVARIIDFPVNFAHKTHIDAGNDCMSCHKGITDKEKTTAEYHLPSGTVCTDCHGTADYSDQENLCLTCHNKDFNFKPNNHTVSWNKDHGISWEIQSHSCTHCHSNSYCINCHEGFNLDREVHPLNFRNSHGIEAKANKDNCLTCHRDFAFCNDCHRIEMVMPKNHSFASWSTPPGGNGGLHAKAAQYDFDYCQTCHIDANSDVVCVKCHGL